MFVVIPSGRHLLVVSAGHLVSNVLSTSVPEGGDGDIFDLKLNFFSSHLLQPLIGAALCRLMDSLPVGALNEQCKVKRFVSCSVENESSVFTDVKLKSEKMSDSDQQPPSSVCACPRLACLFSD